MKKKRLHRCCKCNNIATWFYIPSGNGRRFYCDEHVPRGCTCNVDNIQDFGEPTNDKNVIWWSKNSYENFLKQETDPTKIEEYTTKTRQSDSFYYEQVDEKGRRLPCCEFDYDENGYEIEDSPLLINKGDVLHIFEKAYTYLKNYYSRNEILKGDTDSFYNFFMAFINTWPDKIRYNDFMKMYIELSQKICFSDFKIYIYDFNKSFKSQCIEKTYKEDF